MVQNTGLSQDLHSAELSDDNWQDVS